MQETFVSLNYAAVGQWEGDIYLQGSVIPLDCVSVSLGHDWLAEPDRPRTF